MAFEWHTLPGPSVFLERLKSDLAEGKSVLLDAPETLPIPLDRCLSDRLKAHFHWTHLAAGEDPPLACIRRVIANPTNTSLSSPGKLYDINGFGSRIFYLTDIAPARVPAWVSFLVEFAHATRQQNMLERSAFLVRINGGGPVSLSEDVLLVRRRWEGVVDETDALLLAHGTIRACGFSPVLSNLKAALCAELAQWDLALCDDFESPKHLHPVESCEYSYGLCQELRVECCSPWRAGGYSLEAGNTANLLRTKAPAQCVACVARTD